LIRQGSGIIGLDAQARKAWPVLADGRCGFAGDGLRFARRQRGHWPSWIASSSFRGWPTPSRCGQ